MQQSAPLDAFSESLEASASRTTEPVEPLRAITRDGWTLHVRQTDEVIVADEEIAKHIDLTAHNFRQLSERYQATKHVTPVLSITVIESTGVRGRPAKMAFYTKADALFLITRSDMPKAAGACP